MGDCMNGYIYTQVKNNAKWVLNYERYIEREKLKELFFRNKFLDSREISIVDVGCGNGRSTTLLLEIFENNVEILGIDKYLENIYFAKETIKNQKVNFLNIDAYDFFYKQDSKEKFDVAFFSWSLFDMSNESDFQEKKKKLNKLIQLVKRSLAPNGMIVVLQPTKGGIFEQLLSEFLPGSDADYKLVHNFLIEAGFSGGTSPFPDMNDPWAIWSKFNYNTKEDIYCGVASIVFLEQGNILSQESFEKILDEFLCKHGFCIDDLELTDCVNLYYLIPES